jgi:thiamine-phosphate pyrophosphorylase
VFPPANSARRPILCYVTDRQSRAPGLSRNALAPLVERISSAASAGVDWIQIREKDLSGKEVSDLVRKSLLQTEQSNTQSALATRILVNDRLDVAIAERADGIHLGDNSLPLRHVRKWLNTNRERVGAEQFLVGVSCHSVDDARAAADQGADYIFFGPIFATPSKAAYGTPQGVERLAEVCRAVSIPVLAIGGITTQNASECIGAGAAGVAAIRLFQDSSDLASLVADLRAPVR